MGSHTRLVNTVDIPPPLKEPSFEVLAKPARKMPSSNFSVDYGRCVRERALGQPGLDSCALSAPDEFVAVSPLPGLEGFSAPL